MESALLLDTNALFFRAHHALPPMSTTRGEPTAALYGFSVLLLKLLREERPEGIAFARDLPQPTFRHERYPAYKAGRPAMLDALSTVIQNSPPRVTENSPPPVSRCGLFRADEAGLELVLEPV